jgi:hypothetical protein
MTALALAEEMISASVSVRADIRLFAIETLRLRSTIPGAKVSIPNESARSSPLAEVSPMSVHLSVTGARGSAADRRTLNTACIADLLMTMSPTEMMRDMCPPMKMVVPHAWLWCNRG